MNTAEYRKQAEELTNEVGLYRDSLDEYIKAIRIDIVASADLWMQNNYNNLAVNSHERITEMNEQDTLVKFKADALIVRKGISKHFDELLLKDAIWPHRIDSAPDSRMKKVAEKYVDDVTRELLSPWGSLLANNRLLESGEQSPTWLQTSSNKFIFQHNTGMNTGNLPSVLTYLNLLPQYELLLRKKADMDKKYKESQARDLLG